MDSISDWALLLTSLGVGGVLLKTVEALYGWATGRLGREQSAWAQRDAEAKARRQLEEFAHEQRIVMMRHHIPRAEWPEWPSYDTRGRRSKEESTSER